MSWGQVALPIGFVATFALSVLVYRLRRTARRRTAPSGAAPALSHRRERGGVPRRARWALVLAPVFVVLSCRDEPTGPGPGMTPLGVGAAAVADASVSTQVQVPPAMRSAPFDVPRYLTIPPGFTISVFARVPGARFMAAAPTGDILVSNPGAGTVYRVRPGANGADPAVTAWVSGLRNPHDIVFHTLGGTVYVYVAESHQINRYVYNPDGTAGARQVVVTGLPDNSNGELQGRYGHQLKNIALSGSRLYVSIASPSNADPADLRREPKGGAIYEYDANGGPGRLFAQGLRNAEGLAFVPGTSTLWAVVNNRDNIAYPFHGDFDGNGTDDYGKVIPAYVDDHPPEEFTRVRDGGNYGWPFCNPNPDTPNGNDNMPFDRDVETNADGSQLDCSAADRINKGIQAHSAPLGLTFLQGTNAPSAYREGAVVAYHGSWNRRQHTGYKVVHFPWNSASKLPGTEADLVTGWTNGSSYWGRPVDVAVHRDGSLLISDDYSGTLYRLAPAPPYENVMLVATQSGKCLDVDHARTTNGARIIIWACHGGSNQRWTLPPVGTTGEVRVFGTMCLDADMGTGNDGDAILSWTCHGGPNQKWTLTAAGELRGVKGKCLDVDHARTQNGTRVILWTCHGGSNQKWAPRR